MRKKEDILDVKIKKLSHLKSEDPALLDFLKALLDEFRAFETVFLGVMGDSIDDFIESDERGRC